jgi:sugar/nucleoside kinase (ribokinase family)
VSESGPELVVVGHVTEDQLPDGRRLGGAASYAAQAAACLGIDTGLVTAAPPSSSPLLAPLRRTAGLRVVCAPSDQITTFVLDYSGGRRSLVQRATARPLTTADVPAGWRRAAVVYLGPVAGECDRALVQSFDQSFVGVGLQGWLRRPDKRGVVEPALLPEAERPPGGLRVALLSEEDHPDAAAIAARFATTGAVVALTRGARGATLLAGGAKLDIAPAAVEAEVDPTGAGDVFGILLTLALARGLSPSEAGALAALGAARVVEGPGIGRLPESASTLSARLTRVKS